MLRRLGTHPDIPDIRDRMYLPPDDQRLPRRVDLRPFCPPVYHQHSLNACSANAIAGALWFDERAGAPDAPSPSRLFLYYNERVRERVVHRNVPVSLRDGYRAVAWQGVCAEHLWPYRVRSYDRKPPRACYHAARRHRAIEYFRIHRNLDALRGCLSEGRPFTVGVSVHQSFSSPRVARTGRIPMPGRRDPLRGGHALLIVGYDDAHFIARNSWGARWGLEGYCLLPFEFALHPSLSWDFWTCWRVGRKNLPGRIMTKL
jgi:C1A family cysteine protease